MHHIMIYLPCIPLRKRRRHLRRPSSRPQRNMQHATPGVLQRAPEPARHAYDKKRLFG